MLTERPIKYRAYNPELDQFYTLEKQDFLGSTGIQDPYVGSDKAIWMEFTGSYDQKGREIYEGDILVYISDYGQIMRHLMREVRWTKRKNGSGWNFGDSDRWLVIGNVIEHKHLLKANYEELRHACADA